MNTRVLSLCFPLLRRSEDSRCVVCCPRDTLAPARRRRRHLISDWSWKESRAPPASSLAQTQARKHASTRARKHKHTQARTQAFSLTPKSLHDAPPPNAPAPCVAVLVPYSTPVLAQSGAVRCSQSGTAGRRRLAVWRSPASGAVRATPHQPPGDAYDAAGSQAAAGLRPTSRRRGHTHRGRRRLGTPVRPRPGRGERGRCTTPMREEPTRPATVNARTQEAPRKLRVRSRRGLRTAPTSRSEDCADVPQ